MSCVRLGKLTDLGGSAVVRSFLIPVAAVTLVALTFVGYFAYDSYQTEQTVDAVYDWMNTRGTATPSSKAEIRAWIGDVQGRYGISAADARKAVRAYTVGSR